MKVVMVGTYPEPGKQVAGGVERVIDTLLPELASQVDLTLIRPGASQDAVATTHGVRVVYLKRGPGPGALAYWTFNAKRLAAALETERPDLVHLQGSAGVGRYVQAPRVLTIHGIGHRDLLVSARGAGWGPLIRHGASQIMKAVDERARRHAGNVIVINPYVLEALPDVARLTRFPIPNPLDRAFCAPIDAGTAAAPRPRNIISVGRIGPLKNTLEIIRIAISNMRQDPTTTLTLCGEPVEESYRLACENLIQTEGVAEKADFAGNVDTKTLVSHFDNASVLVMASRQENAPMAIAEAHARGVAVVAPESFGIKYMIKPGHNGFFLPNGDAEEQARAVRAALDHPWDRAAIAAGALATYNPKSVAEQTLAVYREILKNSKGQNGKTPSGNS